MSVFTIQWSILVLGFFEKVFELGHKPQALSTKIEMDITTMITADFACGAVLISMGAVLGKVTHSQLLVMALVEVVFYAINEQIGAGIFMAVDMGGSIFVHTFGAYFGLAVSWMLSKNPQLKKRLDDDLVEPSNKTSDLFAMVGTLFLWMFWPSFNGALAPSSMKSKHRVVINTVFALTASTLSTVATSVVMHDGKLSMEHIQNATLAGGVAVGSSSDLVVGPYGSLLIGFLAGVLSTWGYAWLKKRLQDKIGLHDTCGVHNLHGMPGLLGGVAGSIMAALASEDIYGVNVGKIFPGRTEKNYSAMDQGGYQMAAVVVTLAISISSGCLTGVLLRSGAFDQPNVYFSDHVYFDGVEYDEEKELPKQIG